MQQERGVILAQNSQPLAHNRRLRRLILAAVLPFVGAVAAFGIAPDTATNRVVITKVTEEIALPALPLARNPDETYWHEERIVRGDTIASLLERLPIDDSDAVRELRTTRKVKALYQLIPGKTIRAKIAADGRLLALRYLNGTDLFAVDRDGDELKIVEKPADFETRTLVASGEIRTSLFAATDALNLSDAVAIQMADVFSGDIDFHRDLRKGDTFALVYEGHYHQGELVRNGRIVAAEFVNQGRPYRAVYYVNAEGQGGFYTPEGKNIRKQFLRSPLEFSRISSGFTNARFHPVLKEWRAHKGIDYAAPTGTRVKATGDGVVHSVGRQGGYGNLVVLRHQSKYTTWYGHLSRFAKGVHKGSRVSQGDVIGYVGATGLATGPHLHYEFRINGEHRNPLRVVMPTAPPISAGERAAFNAHAAPLTQLVEMLRGASLARLD
ncbi:MAG: peptidoglycan DD-metalloendopeptidase family protein [Betaproteobacteria bacterium]|nr:peptidoglycan DD-metalloendopeptidase family protein [Betaproteobacteria bacterium]